MSAACDTLAETRDPEDPGDYVKLSSQKCAVALHSVQSRTEDATRSPLYVEQSIERSPFFADTYTNSSMACLETFYEDKTIEYG
ncbi:hypothetical protein Slin15195_G107600 [Septoria linicola]|uniref:Uncharacterized protein n=1 Tax=Septoria linicola TaxID=215465 RepID=A0A9Q9B5C1_9PEZI|nr:hypothetical protein Slin15195_G107600 [Septoria linicola]